MDFFVCLVAAEESVPVFLIRHMYEGVVLVFCYHSSPLCCFLDWFGFGDNVFSCPSWLSLIFATCYIHNIVEGETA